MKPVFADTFYWVALLNIDGSAHDRMVAFDRSATRAFLVTTEETLIEFLKFFSGKGMLFRTKAVAIALGLHKSENVPVIPQTHASYSLGVDLYARRPDKGYSLTDCISMATMEQVGLTDVLTNDQHFEQEGFRALFRL